MKIVLTWPTSKRVKDIQRFLVLANYYQQFMKNFTRIARPLYDLMRKEQKWQCGKRQKKTFEKLKNKFTRELILAILDLDKK